MKRMHAVPGSLYALCLASALAAGPAAAAVDISLDMNSLPSAQGWTYIADQGPAETSVFSVSGGTLYMDSMQANGAYYRLNNVVDPNLSFDLFMRSRITSGGFGFHVYVQLDGYTTVVGFSPSSIYTLNSSGNWVPMASYDNTSFHDYRLTGMPGGTYEVYADNALIGSGLFVQSSDSNGLIFGDGGGTGWATAEITRYRFTQPAPIPEPAAWLLIAGGLALLGIRLRQVRGKA